MDAVGGVSLLVAAALMEDPVTAGSDDEACVWPGKVEVADEPDVSD